MHHDVAGSQLIELNKEIKSRGVLFDPEAVSLEGVYHDELSAFRARKIWVQTLKAHFLLESENDIKMKIAQRESDGLFLLRCDFFTACARYAFWRLTNNQAPEAQYIIETAHIPYCQAHKDEFMYAPDLRSKDESEPAIFSPGDLRPESVPSLWDRVKRLLFS